MNQTSGGNKTADIIDAMVLIIRHPLADGRTIRLAANLIAADARFNQNVEIMKQTSPSKENMLAAIEFSEQTLEECQSIVHGVSRGLRDVNEKSVHDDLVRIRHRVLNFF